VKLSVSKATKKLIQLGHIDEKLNTIKIFQNSLRERGKEITDVNIIAE